jgi:acyl dehydratase
MTGTQADHFEGRWFDDLQVGQRFTAGPRSVSQQDLEQFTELSGDTHPIHWDEEHCRTTPFGRPLLHGAYGFAVASGLMHQTRVFGAAVVAMRELSWEFRKPIFVGDQLSLAMLVTRCRARAGRSSGTVHRWLELQNQDGDVVQAGTSTAVVRRRAEAVDRAAPAELDFGSVDWAGVLATWLAADETFVAATSAFDGAIGFRAGADTSYLRVFRGGVVDVARSSDAARRFCVTGSERAWVDFVLAPRNDFIARATRGDFGVEGDVYEYLRLTKAIHRCWDGIRELAMGARGHDAGQR